MFRLASRTGLSRAVKTIAGEFFGNFMVNKIYRPIVNYPHYNTSEGQYLASSLGHVDVPSFHAFAVADLNSEKNDVKYYADWRT